MTKESEMPPDSGYEQSWMLSMLTYGPALTPQQRQQSKERFLEQLKVGEQAEKDLEAMAAKGREKLKAMDAAAKKTADE